MDPHRSERLIEAMRDELGELIAYEMADPRVSGVSVTEVLLSPDKRKAAVRLHLTGTPQQRQDALEAVTHARGFLKRELAARLQLFRMPELYFESGAELGPEARVESLLRRMRRGRPRDGRPDEQKSTAK